MATEVEKDMDTKMSQVRVCRHIMHLLLYTYRVIKTPSLMTSSNKRQSNFSLQALPCEQCYRPFFKLSVQKQVCIITSKMYYFTKKEIISEAQHKTFIEVIESIISRHLKMW